MLGHTIVSSISVVSTNGCRTSHVLSFLVGVVGVGKMAKFQPKVQKKSRKKRYAPLIWNTVVHQYASK